MILKSADIRNFRSIAEQTVTFDPRCRVLVGVSESGKSNVLGALGLLDPDRSATPDDIRELHPNEPKDQEAYVEFWFEFEQSERIAHRDRFLESSPGASAGKKLVSIGGRSFTVSQFFDRFVTASYRIDLKTDEAEYRTPEFEEDAALAENWFVAAPAWPKAEQVVLKDGTGVSQDDIEFVHSSALGQFPEGHLQPATLADLRELAFRYAEDTADANRPSCIFWSYRDENLLPAQLDTSAFAKNPDLCVPLKQMFKLAGYANIGEAITAASLRQQGLRNLLARVAEVATTHVRKVWRDYKDLRIELIPAGTTIDAHVRDKHNSFGFSRRSDGFKRFVSFLLMVSTQELLDELTNTLFIQDEPDNGLHPSGVRHLRDELIRISQRNYVVVSTHSIFMVDREEVRRHLIVTKKDEVTTLDEASESNIKDEEVVYRALGYSMFETLERKNVIFEGWRDKKLFQAYSGLKSGGSDNPKKAKKSFGMCHANGLGDIGRVAAVLELGAREWIVVSDSDEPAKRFKSEYEGEGTWYCYDDLDASTDAVTGEDFIEATAYASAVEEMIARDVTLQTAKAPELPAANRLAKLRKWFASQGLAAGVAKGHLDWLKSRLFSQLTRDMIKPEYERIADAIIARVGD